MLGLRVTVIGVFERLTHVDLRTRAGDNQIGTGLVILAKPTAG